MAEQPHNVEGDIAEMRAAIGRMEAQLKKVRRYFFWSTFYGWVKLMVILASLALGTWYLSPYLSSIHAALSTLSNSFSTKRGQNQNSAPSPLDDPRVRAYIESQMKAQ